MSQWGAHNGCDPNFTEERFGTEVRRRTWNNCQDGSTAVFYIIDGGGHTWPGSPKATGRLGLDDDPDRCVADDLGLLRAAPTAIAAPLTPLTSPSGASLGARRQ